MPEARGMDILKRPSEFNAIAIAVEYTRKDRECTRSCTSSQSAASAEAMTVPVKCPWAISSARLGPREHAYARLGTSGFEHLAHEGESIPSQALRRADEPRRGRKERAEAFGHRG